MINLKKNKKRGFTLIELVAVIVILGVLMKLAVPNFINTTEIIGAQELLNNIGIIQYKASVEKIKIETDLISYYGLSEIDINTVQTAYNNQRLFNKDGHVESVDFSGYYDLTGSELLDNTYGYNSGTFLIKDDKIFFISDKDIEINFDIDSDGS